MNRGRKEKVIDSGNGAAAEFASALRNVRRQAGNPTYRHMAATAHYSAPALSSAASGKKMPSWEVTAAYLRACGVTDLEPWQQDWNTAGIRMRLSRTKARHTPGHHSKRRTPAGSACNERDALDAQTANLLEMLVQARVTRGLSLRTIAERSKRLHVEGAAGRALRKLSSTSIHEVLTGKRRADSEFIQSYLMAVDASEDEQDRIGEAFGRLGDVRRIARAREALREFINAKPAEDVCYRPYIKTHDNTPDEQPASPPPQQAEAAGSFQVAQPITAASSQPGPQRTHHQADEFPCPTFAPALADSGPAAPFFGFGNPSPSDIGPGSRWKPTVSSDAWRPAFNPWPATDEEWERANTPYEHRHRAQKPDRLPFEAGEQPPSESGELYEVRCHRYRKGYHGRLLEARIDQLSRVNWKRVAATLAATVSTAVGLGILGAYVPELTRPAAAQLLIWAGTTLLVLDAVLLTGYWRKLGRVLAGRQAWAKRSAWRRRAHVGTHRVGSQTQPGFMSAARAIHPISQRPERSQGGDSVTNSKQTLPLWVGPTAARLVSPEPDCQTNERRPPWAFRIGLTTWWRELGRRAWKRLLTEPTTERKLVAIALAMPIALGATQVLTLLAAVVDHRPTIDCAMTQGESNLTMAGQFTGTGAGMPVWPQPDNGMSSVLRAGSSRLTQGGLLRTIQSRHAPEPGIAIAVPELAIQAGTGDGRRAASSWCHMTKKSSADLGRWPSPEVRRPPANGGSGG